MLLNFLKKMDAILLIMIGTILVGVIVIAMRSKTYAVGYEISRLKMMEQNLKQHRLELQAQLAFAQRQAREKLLNERLPSGDYKYLLPNESHVLRE